MTRVNSYTGVAYVNDPTILAWETGNELGGASNPLLPHSTRVAPDTLAGWCTGYINAEQWPPLSWTHTVRAVRLPVPCARRGWGRRHPGLASERMPPD